MRIPIHKFINLDKNTSASYLAIMCGVIILCGVLTILFTYTAFSVQEKRIALVIGNGDYKSSPLANPVNDASDVAAALEKCNFTVIKKINADRKGMRRAIRKFGNEINKGAVGLFYYAGHGIQVNGENYLVPIGADVHSEAEVEDECLMVSSVLRQMEWAGNRLNIIILDACRDNPFGRSFRSSRSGLAKMDAPTGSILAYATAPGSVAADGSGRNGLYTSNLLRYISKPGLKIEELFKRIRIDVMNASEKRQIPWESSSLTGDFFFNPPRGIAVTERPVEEAQQPPTTDTPAASLNQETAFWQSIQNSSDPASYEAYLAKFPQGTFVELAKLRIEKLKKESSSSTVAVVEPGNISGNWKTTYGLMKFTQSGTRVEGVYPIGQVKGTLTGNTLKGRWFEGPASGEFQFNFSSDWRSFKGGWRIGSWDSWADWSGSR